MVSSFYRLALLGSAAALLLPGAGELSNRPAPPFRLPDTKGRTVSLADFKGKFLVIEFMSTTCSHCQHFAPVLESLHDRFQGRVGVVSIAPHPDNAITVTKFAQSYQVTYPILLDPEHKATLAYLRPAPPKYNFSIPHVFLVDQTGFVRDDFTQNPSNQALFTPAGFARLIESYIDRR